MRYMLFFTLASVWATGCQPTISNTGADVEPEGGSDGIGYDMGSPEAQNEFVFWNFTRKDAIAVRVSWGKRVVELGPVVSGANAVAVLPAGAPGYFRVTYVWSDGTEGGTDWGDPDAGPMFGKWHTFNRFEDCACGASGDRPRRDGDWNGEPAGTPDRGGEE